MNRQSLELLSNPALASAIWILAYRAKGSKMMRNQAREHTIIGSSCLLKCKKLPILIPGLASQSTLVMMQDGA
jgi:hypothetical protein